MFFDNNYNIMHQIFYHFYGRGLSDNLMLQYRILIKQFHNKKMNYKKKHYFKVFLRYTPLYRKTTKSILQQESNKSLLKEHIYKYIEEVPYYHKHKNIIGESFDIKKIPIIRKPDIQGHEIEFVSKKVNKHFLFKEKTRYI